jgi:hypothetical protein
LVVRSGGYGGEIHVLDGAVANALWMDLRGEEAFYAMIGLQEGEFALDASFRPPSRVIDASTESLLLEAMRRLDERRA